MNGMFRYAKSIAGSLALMAVAAGAKYGQSWVFRDVEDLPAASSSSYVGLDDLSLGGRAESPMRTANDAEAAAWKIAVVTNRQLSDEAAAAQLAESRLSSSVVRRTLSQQLADAVYRTANSTMGFADVRVPHDRRRGECRTTGDPAAQVAVGPVSYVTNDDFYDQLQQSIDQTRSKDVFVFVHGFNVSLNAAVARAAQLAEDMPFNGVMVVFSWPSEASADAYLSDEKQAERHFWALAELLINLKRNCGNDSRLHVLAHSMGNRVALRALNALAGTIGPTGAEVDPFLLARMSRTAQQMNAEGGNFRGESIVGQEFRNGVVDVTAELPQRFPDWAVWRKANVESPPLANLVMAAPDVDAVEFARFTDGIRHVCGTMVLYASDSDFALEGSRKLHGGRYRAGDSRAGIDIEGLQVVRVSGVDSLDPLGHSYYGSHAKVLAQLHGLIKPPVVAGRVSDWR